MATPLAYNYEVKHHRGVAQLVARVLWEHEAEGSSPFTPTMELFVR